MVEDSPRRASEESLYGQCIVCSRSNSQLVPAQILSMMNSEELQNLCEPLIESISIDWREGQENIAAKFNKNVGPASPNSKFYLASSGITDEGTQGNLVTQWLKFHT